MRSNIRIINLTIHGIGTPKRLIPPGEKPMWLGQEQFGAILDAIVGRSNVAITFDDGNKSDVELALPALLSRGLKATFFVLAGRLGQSGSVSAQDLRTLREAGMGIGLHGMAHRPWRGMSDKQLKLELVEAREKLADALGERVTQAACPFGTYGRRALRRLRDEGFERVYTSDRGAVEANAWLQARNTITAMDDIKSVEQICVGGRPSWSRGIKVAIKRHLWA